MTPERIKHNLLVFIVLMTALTAGLFYLANLSLIKIEKIEQENEEKIRTTLSTVPVIARSVSVYNVSGSKKLYGKNDEVPMPIASLAKLMTVPISLNQEKNSVVTISPEAIAQAGDYGLLVNEQWKAEDLAKITLISSANDGAYVLASGIPDVLERMNSKAKKIGGVGVLFQNFTGLDREPGTAGAHASAEEVNTMAIYLFRGYPEIAGVTALPEINLTSLSGFTHNFKNTNPITGKIPNLLFSKTGFTDTAGGNLTVIFRNNRGEEIAVTVLGSTFEGRFSDMENLVNVLYNL